MLQYVADKFRIHGSSAYVRLLYDERKCFPLPLESRSDGPYHRGLDTHYSDLLPCPLFSLKANELDATMLLNVDGLDESGMSSPSICNFGVDPDVDMRRDAAIPSETFWDCSPYSDFAQTWLGNDAFSAGYGREKNSTLAITSQPFSDTLNSESPSILFTFRESFPVELSDKQTDYRDDPWGPFLSPDLSSPMDDACSPSLVFQGTGKENIPPSSSSPTLNDFAGFRGTTSIWTDSPSAKFGIDSPQKPDLGGSDAFVGISPASGYLPQPSRGQRKGLFGWGDTSHLHPPIPAPSVFRQNCPRRPRSSSRSSDVDAVLDPYPLTLDSSPPIRKRARQSTPSRGSSDIESESSSLDSSDENDLVDGNGSDDYRPSPSPSPKFERFKIKPPPCPTPPPKPAVRSLKRGKPTKSRRVEKKGSAALALAVVTQIGEAKLEAQNLQVSLDPDSFDPVRVYHEGGYVVKKRKNQPIPVPIPVPNLNKKSRGRKVPFVANSTANTVSAPLIEHHLRGQLHKPANSRRKAQTASASDESGASRSFVCVVPGCGKCFVRGEHLKRHVRSIHTNDKPHVCPFDGCHKSFSRRDNLGQHVRVHLQP